MNYRRHLDHVLLPCKMTSTRIPDKNLRIVGTETLLDRGISRFQAWFPGVEIWVASEDRRAIDKATRRGCFPYPLTQADIDDQRSVSELFDEFLQRHGPLSRCLCAHLDSPFVFRSELEQAISDPRPFVASAILGRFFFGGEALDAYPLLSQQMPDRAILTGNFLVADGKYRPTPEDYATQLSPVSWLSGLDINTFDDLSHAHELAKFVDLAFCDDWSPT